MIIRKFEEKDREFILDIMNEFYHTDAVEKPLSLSTIKRVFDDCMASSPFIEGYIFETEGTPCGYGIITFGYATEAGGICLWIEDIYIRPEFRGRGLGSAFFKMLDEKYGKRVYRMRLDVEPENEGAVYLYLKNGFRHLEYSAMIKEINPNE